MNIFSNSLSLLKQTIINSDESKIKCDLDFNSDYLTLRSAGNNVYSLVYFFNGTVNSTYSCFSFGIAPVCMI